MSEQRQPLQNMDAGEGISSRPRGKRTKTITPIDNSSFNVDLVLDNEINYALNLDGERAARLAIPGSLGDLLNNLAAASNNSTSLTQDEKTLLDFKLLENSAYITGPDFLSDLSKIPSNNEVEWIARCHNKLSEFFRRFQTWEALSVGSAQIGCGIKVDRIFGFGIQSQYFTPWMKHLGCWPFLLIQSKPASILESCKEGDWWKMPIIQALAWEQQEKVIDKLSLPSDYCKAHVHLPLTFGIYYTGSIVNIGIYFYHNGQKHYCTFKGLDLKTDATSIMQMFAIIKSYINLMHKSVQDAFDTGHWMTPMEVDLPPTICTCCNCTESCSNK